MKNRISLVPFTDFWIECTENDNLSVVISMDDSYKKAAYMNDYKYVVSQKYNEVLVKRNSSFYEKIPRISINSVDNYDIDIINTIRNYVNQGKILYIPVDVFYWLKSSTDWKNKHMLHYEMIIGYDDEKRIVNVFTDDIHGYHEIEVDYDNFVNAYEMSKCLEIKEIIPPKILSVYEFDKDLLKKNAIHICDSIEVVLQTNGLFNISEVTYEDVGNVTEITAIQTANLLLIKNLFDDGCITLEEFKVLEHFIQECSKKWQIVKGLLIKLLVVKLSPPCDRINDLIKDALSIEKECWKQYLAICENKEER